MRKYEKVIALLIFALTLTGVVISRVDQSLFEGLYVKEDGFIEWMTVLALLLSALLCFYRVHILWPWKKKIFLLATFLMGAVFMFGVGEEISWGQRLFNFKSPEFFMKHNTQYEMNLHNLVLGGIRINKLIFGLLLSILVVSYFLILPFFYRQGKKIKHFVDFVAIPVPRISHIFLYLVLGGLVLLIPSAKKGEILEFGGCWIFFLMILNPYNKNNFIKRIPS